MNWQRNVSSSFFTLGGVVRNIILGSVAYHGVVRVIVYYFKMSFLFIFKSRLQFDFKYSNLIAIAGVSDSKNSHKTVRNIFSINLTWILNA